MNKKSLKTSRIACIIASAAVLISAVSMLISALGSQPMWPSVTIFCSMIAVLCANLSLYSKNKKENSAE